MNSGYPERFARRLRILGFWLLGSVFLFALVAVLKCGEWDKKMDVAVKGATIFGALVFFLYKAASGSLAAATSLTLVVAPAWVNNERVGVVTLTVERGENYSVQVQDIWLTVACDNQRQQIAVPFKAKGRDDYYLSPGERTQYGLVIPLREGIVATVEAVVVVKQQYFPMPSAYVYASAVVAPPV
jgi:hypothetical protein